MNEQIHRQLRELYGSFGLSPDRIAVVPSIRRHMPDTDYLYQLYKPFLEPESGYPPVEDLSIWAHWKPVLWHLSGKKAVWHYHWLEFQTWPALFGMIWKLWCLSLFTAFGGSLVWTVHNRLPHDRRFLAGNIKLMHWMAGKADRIHFHCEQAAEEMSAMLNIPQEKCVIIPHPLFEAHTSDPNAAQKRLAEMFDFTVPEENTLFLMLGQIAPYKGYLAVIDLIKQCDGAHLLIAGAPKPRTSRYMRQLNEAAADCERITLLPRFIPDVAIPDLMEVTNYMVMNTNDIYASGTAALARSYGLPLIAPQIGCISDQSDEGDYLFRTRGELRQLLRQLSG